MDGDWQSLGYLLCNSLEKKREGGRRRRTAAAMLCSCGQLNDVKEAAAAAAETGPLVKYALAHDGS